MTRDGDGHAEVVFTVTSLRAGARPALVVSRSADAPLLRRAFAADYGSSTATEGGASAEVGRVASGAIDLMPLPARDLTAPSESVALSVRLGAQTSTVRRALVGHSTRRLLRGRGAVTPYTAHFVGGSSLERCALHCHRNAKRAAAVGFAVSQDSCACLPAGRMPAAARAAPAASCSALCSAADVGEGGQLCGAPATVEVAAMASVYRLPASLSTDGTKLPCSFSFQQGLTPSIATARPQPPRARRSLTGTNLPRRPKVTTTIGAPTVSVRRPRVRSHRLRLHADCVYDAGATRSRAIDPRSRRPARLCCSRWLPSVAGVAATAVEGRAGWAGGARLGGGRRAAHGDGHRLLREAGDMSVALCEGVDRSAPRPGAASACDVIRSGGGSLECVTSAATGVAEEATLSLRVTRAGAAQGRSPPQRPYQLLTTAQSLTVESLSSATGSTLGGMKLCITGTNLGPCERSGGGGEHWRRGVRLSLPSTPISLLHDGARRRRHRRGGRAPRSSATPSRRAVLEFTYAVPPAVSSITPSVAHAGSLVTLTFDSLSAEDAPEFHRRARVRAAGRGLRGTDATSGLPTVSCVVARRARRR